MTAKSLRIAIGLLLLALSGAAAAGVQTPVYCVASTDTACNTTSNPGNGTQGDPAWLAFGKTNSWATQLGLFSNSPANEFLATPSGTTGVPGLRAITGIDIPPINLAITTNGGVTGLLPIANGGTGTATPSLVAGTNVTITGTWPDQTIAASGGGSMVYPGAGIPLSTGTAWGTSITPGTGVDTALAVNVGTAGSFVLNGGALGTPSSGVATNLTGTASALNIGGTAANITATSNSTLTTLSALSLPSSQVTGLGTFATQNYATPPAIGGTTPAAGSFTTLSATGQITSTLATGTAPFSVASTTQVTNLNAASVGGFTLPCTVPSLVSGDYLTNNGTTCSWAAVSGSGTVNSGTSGQLAYYAATGTAVSGATVGSGLTLSSGTLSTTQALNAQTGTTYTIATTDADKVITFNNASATAVTLPAATTTGFGAGFAFTVQNTGVGLVTITPTTSTINGLASLSVAINYGCSILSDGTNYQTPDCGALQTHVYALAAGISVTPDCAYKINTVTSTAYTIAAPTNGALTQTAGGTLAAATYYVKSTWVTASGQTTGATETSLAVSADNVLNVAAPASPPANATGWDVYVSTATGTETLQASGIGTATAWVEPTTGLVSGAALPSSNTSGAFTVNLPNGCAPKSGQKLILFVQSASGGTLLYVPNAGYITGSTTGPWPTNSGAASKDDHFVLIYDGYLATPGWTLDGYNLGL